MIHDIAPHTYDNQYAPHTPRDEDIVLAYRKGEILCNYEDDVLSFPTLLQLGASADTLTYLFTIDQTRYFLAGVEVDPFAGFAYRPVSLARTAMPRVASFAAITGHQLSVWYRDSRFCGRCGTPTVHDGVERMMRCPNCGSMIFPRISPAVIVGVLNGDRILMTRYANRPGAKRSALIAGFAEIGESIEQTVRREVMEEVGLRVKNLRYYKSQPWSFTGCLLMGFWCEVDGDDTIHVDGRELAEGVWLTREEIDWDDIGLSLTGEMTQRFRDGLARVEE
ncbi:MAG: NAD(+) diphosphatase [Oscillospiraceae bacterium]|nr:NAD(+) diphosphatase [Oscillospiraceae bacterium]